MNERDIQVILHNYYGRGKAVACLPNTYMVMGKFEADLVVLLPGGMVVEFEIKTSRSDFRSEFMHKSGKHEYLSSGDLLYKSSSCGQDGYFPTHLPNRYVFVAPAGVLSEVDIPGYAGLMEVDPDTRILRVVKRSPFIHRNKASAELLTKLLSSVDRKIWK